MAVKKWEFKTSQNTFEDEFIQSLRRCIPRGVKAVIVADRGFRRTDFLRFIESLDLGYVIRVKGDVWIECPGYSGKLGHYPLSVGQTFKVNNVLIHKQKRHPIKMVFNCAKIEGKVSSWLIATNLGLTAGQIVNIYRRRFWCEESFRDQKQEFELEKVRVKRARRLE
ncbi:MAG: transposase, partial [Nitrososphaera sp.]|nr:transposase [Nitrososphaera sp.]